MDKENGDQKNDSGNRWWEFYFVRYFVGTIVGGLILLYLNISPSSKLEGKIMPGVTGIEGLSVEHFGLLAALGLAYCYVASAPILVFHAGRAPLMDSPPPPRTRWGLAFVIAGTAVVVGVLGLLGLLPTPVAYLSAGLLAFVILMQLFVLGITLNKDCERTHLYYSQLTKARSLGGDAGLEYIESYRHLREHGNAFFIVCFEVAFGMLLASAWNLAFVIISAIFWVVPAACVWIIGTRLEHHFMMSISTKSKEPEG